MTTKIPPAKGALSPNELAGKLGANPDALSRLMRPLIGRGVFRRQHDGRYGLTPLADVLRSDTPVSLAGRARYAGSPQARERWSWLVDSIRSGKAIVW